MGQHHKESPLADDVDWFPSHTSLDQLAAPRLGLCLWTW